MPKLCMCLSSGNDHNRNDSRDFPTIRPKLSEICSITGNSQREIYLDSVNYTRICHAICLMVVNPPVKSYSLSYFDKIIDLF